MSSTARGNGEMRQPPKRLVRKHTDLEVFRRAFDVAMELFDLSKSFPREERYSLTDQMRRSSRSVSTNIAEAWRKRRYEAAFAAKLNDAEAEAAETQTWIQFCVECKYLKRDVAVALYTEYDEILSMQVAMIRNAHAWKR